MQYSQEQKASARKMLKGLKPGDSVFTNVTHVSRSGMFRRIRCYIMQDGTIYDVTWAVARLLDWSMNDRGLAVGGCGMDMCFHTVYNLSYMLFPYGFGIEGTRSNGRKVRARTEFEACRLFAQGVKFRGRNGDASGWDDSGGYALNKRDL